MVTSVTNSYSNSIPSSTGAPYAPKAYGTDSGYQTKALSTADAQKTELANWWKNEWYPWFVEFKQNGGNIQEIDGQLLDSAIWAAQQLNIDFDPWDPTSVAAQSEAYSASPQSDEWGGYPGSQDNLVYDGTEITVGYDGSPYAHDIWGNDITILSDSNLVTWTAEVTMDTRFQPPEKVVKIVGYNKESGQSSVYYAHGLEDVESITIQTPGGKKVSLVGDAANLKNANGDPLIKAEEYKGEKSNGGSGLPPNPEHPEDSIPHYYDGNTAVYDNEKDININAYYDDDITHDITAPGTVTLYASSYADTAKVEYDPTTQTKTVYLYKNGDPSQVEKFVIHCGPDTEVVISGLLSEDKVEGLPIDGVSVGAPDTEGSTNVTKSNFVGQLLDETGKTENQLLNALKEAGYPYTSMKELEEAVQDGEFPPSEGPTSQFVHFLMIFDPEFNEKAMKASVAKDGTVNIDAYTDANQRLIEMLQMAYPDSNISFYYSEEDQDMHISMDGKNYLPQYTSMDGSGIVPLQMWEGDWSADKEQTV